MTAMRWNVAAPFFRSEVGASNLWIDDFVDESDLTFAKIGTSARQSSWHTRSARGTPLRNWPGFWRQTSDAFDADGIVTVFPQLAAMAGLRKRLSRKRIPLVAWCFNVGRLPGGASRRLAQFALAEAARIVVHSSDEVPLIGDYLGVAPGVVEFVPLQRAAIEHLSKEETDRPFALAMGSANRDYPLLIEAAQRTRLPLKIVAAPRLLADLDIPDTVEVLSDLTPLECLKLAQQARFSIVPLADVKVASGQVTVVEAMRMKRPIVATRSSGTKDYVEDDVSGLLVPPDDLAALTTAMERLWHEVDLRGRLSHNAAAFAEARLSDEAAAAALVRIVRDVATGA